MDIEQIFAAQVVGAERQAEIARKHGIAQSAADFIEMALDDLWKHDRNNAQAIADRYVTWDLAGRPQPRPMAANVVALRRH